MVKQFHKYALVILACLPTVLDTHGQESEAADSLVTDSLRKCNFRFVYIDHEKKTPVGEVCRRLEKLRNDALETGDKLIVYLANDEEPVISFTNLDDPDSTMHRNSQDAFFDVIDEMQHGMDYHWVNASTDTATIKRLIGSDGAFPLFYEKGSDELLRYASVCIDFYVGESFWFRHNNEKVIAYLYVSLQLPYYMERCPASELSLAVLKPKECELLYAEGMPFGMSNMGGINKKISIIEY